MSETTWVLVADAARAQLYASRLPDELILVREFAHPQSRLKGQDITTDRSGHLQGKGVGHAANEPGDAKRHEAGNFASELVQALEHGRTTNAYTRLVIVAAPHFHGVLNQHLSTQVRDKVSANIEKNYTQLAGNELRAKLSEYIMTVKRAIN